MNYDDPASIDDAALLSTLVQLKAGKDVSIPIYDFSIHAHVAEQIVIKTADIIILEGIFAFTWPHVREHMNFRIFVDCSGELRLMRRIMRDTKERGRSIDSII